MQRPTVSKVIVGARNEAKLRDNLGDAASEVTPVYPFWRQRSFGERNPPPV